MKHHRGQWIASENDVNIIRRVTFMETRVYVEEKNGGGIVDVQALHSRTAIFFII